MNRAARWAGAVIALVATTGQAQTTPPGTPDVPGGAGTLRGKIVHASRPEAAAGVSVLLYALPESAPPGVRQRTCVVARLSSVGWRSLGCDSNQMA